MIQAYNKTDLYNKHVQQQASEAFHAQAITAETYAAILTAHSLKLYTPNYFIRISLGLLTVVAIVFSALLTWLISGATLDNAFITLLIFLSIASYITLEVLIKIKPYYNAGTDNILMLFIIFFITGVFFVKDFPNQNIVVSGSLLMICLLLCVRFTDGFMAIISVSALLSLIFFILIKLSGEAKVIAPFIMMIASAVIYFIAGKLKKNERLWIYTSCCKAVMLFTLIAFYASGNYFVVKEASNEIFHLNLKLHDSISFGWLFWMFTISIPFIYIINGIIKKDLLFIRTGLLLIAVTLFTITYYYQLFAFEVHMLIAGVMLIAISYALIKYLRNPKHGFTFNSSAYNKTDILNAEALIVAQVFGKQSHVHKGIKYGGGSSGGGGATGSF